MAGVRGIAERRDDGFQPGRRTGRRRRDQGKTHAAFWKRDTMKFAEITAGCRFTLGPAKVDRDEVIAFAAQYDDQWFHTDPARAADGPFHGLIASGWHTCALAMQLVSRSILADSESYASPGLSYVRW